MSDQATCQVLTVESARGGGAALHIAGMEINLPLSDTLRISRLLFKALEELADRALIVEMNAEIEPFVLEWPTPTTAAQGGKASAGGLDLEAMVPRAALEDALEGMEDMIGYVTEYFRNKWSHPDYIERAKAVLARSIPVPAPLVWTEEKPKVEGLYWFRESFQAEGSIYRAHTIGDRLVFMGPQWRAVEEIDPTLGHEWAGPIPQPGSNTPKGAE
jgi:hypothetical protein